VILRFPDGGMAKHRPEGLGPRAGLFCPRRFPGFHTVIAVGLPRRTNLLSGKLPSPTCKTKLSGSYILGIPSPLAQPLVRAANKGLRLRVIPTQQ
jgi:hypothetical protein